MNYVISKEQLQKVLDYFAQRPWGEANAFIGMLAKLPQVPAPQQPEQTEPANG